MSFPEQLKKARIERGFTQQEVADLMGVTNSAYCGYETGKRQPDVAKIKMLAKILNTPPDVLLETNQDNATPIIPDGYMIIKDQGEQNLIKDYRELSNFGKGYVRGVLKSYLITERKSTKEELEQREASIDISSEKFIEILSEMDENQLDAFTELLQELVDNKS